MGGAGIDAAHRNAGTVKLAAAMLLFAAGGCGPKQVEPTSEPPAETATATATAMTAAPATASVSAAPDAPWLPPTYASVAGEPFPYPTDAVDRAVAANDDKLGCDHLIYKRGCAEKRTGTVKVKVTLAADGTVASFEVVENAISFEPKVVERCIRERLPKWKFEPPSGTSPTFEMTWRFSDKC
ncbi:MAG: energy transducer TonB [Polyangiaceae bacterium]|nr:energy transducer TonB [Polyangiaceae bacterium]